MLDWIPLPLFCFASIHLEIVNLKNLFKIILNLAATYWSLPIGAFSQIVIETIWKTSLSNELRQ